MRFQPLQLGPQKKRGRPSSGLGGASGSDKSSPKPSPLKPSAPKKPRKQKQGGDGSAISDAATGNVDLDVGDAEEPEVKTPGRIPRAAKLAAQEKLRKDSPHKEKAATPPAEGEKHHLDIFGFEKVPADKVASVAEDTEGLGGHFWIS